MSGEGGGLALRTARVMTSVRDAGRTGGWETRMRTAVAASFIAAAVLAVLAAATCATTQQQPTAAEPARTQPLGAACAATEGALPPSTCQDGLLCAPLPGGMCTAACGGGAACPAGSVCTDAVAIGELCAPSCMSDVDCRADQGYVCDAVTSACLPPGAAKPQLGDCAAPGPKKKRFQAAAALTDASDLGVWQTDAAGAVLPSGALIALYASMGRLGEPSNVGATMLEKPGAPATDAALKSDQAQAQDPWLAIDAAGKVHAVWLDGDGALGPAQGARVAYATTTDGVTWSPVVAVHDEADCPTTERGCLGAPMIAIGPAPADAKAQAVYVAYFAPAKGELRVRRSLDGGATWEPAVGAGPGAYGDLAVSADGHVHVVTTIATVPTADRLGDAANAVLHRKSTDGGKTFSPPARVNPPDAPVPLLFGAPQVAYDAKKRLLYVAYTGGTNDGKWDVRLATSKDGATFTSIQVNDDVPCANHRSPALVLDPKSGRPHLVWIENRTDAGAIAYARCEVGGRKCGRNEAVSDEPFAAYGFARRGTREAGRRPWLTIDKKAKKLHALWTQPVAPNDADAADGGAPIARVFHAAGKLE